jgi:hypothetical protein
VILRDRLLAALARINPHSAAALEQAVTSCRRSASWRWCNRSFHRLLLSGDSGVLVGDEKKTDLVHLIDFAKRSRTSFW